MDHPGMNQWEFRRPRRERGAFGYAMIGAVAGALIVVMVMLALGYLPGGPGAMQNDSALGPGGTGVAGETHDSPGNIARAEEPLNDPMSSSAVVQVVKEVGPSVVGVINYQTVRNAWSGSAAEVPRGFGSGFVIDREGHIVTNYHVIEDASRLEVVIGDQNQRVEARVVAHDYPYADVAVLQVNPADLPADVEFKPARWGDSDNLQVGETVVAIGNPKGLEFFRSATVGVISGIRSDLLQQLERQSGYAANSRIFTLLQTDAAINNGNSGGPLVNLHGEVIGVNTLKFSGTATEGMGFALPANEVRHVVSELIAKGYVERPALGVAVIPEDVARTRYGVEEGLLVEVESGGPASQAGMRSGDIILAIDGRKTDQFLDLLKAISRHEVGDQITLTIRRDGRDFDLSVRLGRLSSGAQPD